MKIDPRNKHSNVTREDMLSMLGFIPYWLNPADPRPAKEQLEEKYGLGPLFDMKATIVNGVYHSESAEDDDDPLWPLAEIPLHDDVIYIYEYGIVGIVNTQTGETFTTRMD